MGGLNLALLGFGTGLSLIVAIGAQNAYVLRQGVRREHEVAVATLCTAADAALIVAGTAGIGALVEAAPMALEVFRWAGVAFLVVYAGLALRRATRPEALVVAGSAEPSLRRSLATAAALTFLNPHVYLDTMLFIGSVANQHAHRWVFAAGAVAASALWFYGLALGARRLTGLFADPRTWRVLDLAVAAIMVAVAISLATTRL